MLTIAIHHRKGGVGKTSTAQHLADAAARGGNKTLLIDADGQGNLTGAFGLSGSGLDEVLRAMMNDEDVPWQQHIQSVTDNLDVLPAGPNSFQVQTEIVQYDGVRGSFIRDALRQLKDEYKLVVIDTGPGEGWLASNALLAADRIVAPVMCETFAVDGLLGLTSTLAKIGKRNIRKELRAAAIVPTMFHGARKAHRELLNILRDRFGDAVTKTVIRVDANIEAAQSNNQTIFQYAPSSRAADDYFDLTKELVS